MSALASFKKLQFAWCFLMIFLPFYEDVMYQLNRSFNISPPPPNPRHTLGIWHLCHPGEEGIWLSESFRGWRIWTISLDFENWKPWNVIFCILGTKLRTKECVFRSRKSVSHSLNFWSISHNQFLQAMNKWWKLNYILLQVNKFCVNL